MASVVDYKRPGSYPEFMQRRAATLPVSAAQTVAVLATDDWGPVDTAVTYNSFAEYLEERKPLDPEGSPSGGYIAAYNAFRGEDSVTPGAGAIVFYRLIGSAGAKAAVTLNNATPAAALTLTALYEGTRGNNLKVRVSANATDPSTHRDLAILDGDVVIENYRHYAVAEYTTAMADINAASEWVVASAALNGALLATGTFPLTGGNSGTTLTAGDYTAAQLALESERFGYFAPYGLSDDAIQAAMFAWAIALNDKPKAKKFFAGVSGAADETYSTAATRSSEADHECIVNLHVPRVRDTRLGIEMSGAQLLPRLMGIMAQRGGRSGITFAQLEDIEIITGVSDDDALLALDEGVVLVERGETGCNLSKGLTTYISDTADKPNETYSRIKYVTTMHGIYRRSRERNESGQIIGKLNVNNDTRESLLKDLQKDIANLVQNGEIQSVEAFARIASDPVPSDDDEFVVLEWGGKFARELSAVVERIYLS